VDYKPDQYQESIVIRTDNGHRVRNKRQATARTSFDNKQQESLTKKKSSNIPSATKKAKTNPNPPVFSSDEEVPKRPAERSSKTINSKSNSANESVSSYEKSSSEDESKKSNDSPSSDEESKKSEHNAVPSISLRNILNPDYTDEDFRSV
jgi:hypothetical protein